ncbi:hypothetical protein BKA81DRAFT_3647 [Phyllosticta paracitricarpa]
MVIAFQLSVLSVSVSVSGLERRQGSRRCPSPVPLAVLHSADCGCACACACTCTCTCRARAPTSTSTSLTTDLPYLLFHLSQPPPSPPLLFARDRTFTACVLRPSLIFVAQTSTISARASWSSLFFRRPSHPPSPLPRPRPQTKPNIQRCRSCRAAVSSPSPPRQSSLVSRYRLPCSLAALQLAPSLPLPPSLLHLSFPRNITSRTPFALHLASAKPGPSFCFFFVALFCPLPLCYSPPFHYFLPRRHPLIVASALRTPPGFAKALLTGLLTRDRLITLRVSATLASSASQTPHHTTTTNKPAFFDRLPRLCVQSPQQ